MTVFGFMFVQFSCFSLHTGADTCCVLVFVYVVFISPCGIFNSFVAHVARFLFVSVLLLCVCCFISVFCCVVVVVSLCLVFVCL